MGVVLINYRKRGIDMSLFRVAIHYGVNSNGFLSYDTETKTVSVDLPDLKLALTRMWEAIDVQVDWSRPA